LVTRGSQNQVDQQEQNQRAFHPSRSPVAVKPPNGIRFSRRERAQASEAVG
jgi:hypothetical protein